jgi:hypothetical protein
MLVLKFTVPMTYLTYIMLYYTQELQLKNPAPSIASILRKYYPEPICKLLFYNYYFFLVLVTTFTQKLFVSWVNLERGTTRNLL